MKDYKVRIKMLIEANCYVAAEDKRAAADIFKNDPKHEFDEIEKLIKYQIVGVEPVKNK